MANTLYNERGDRFDHLSTDGLPNDHRQRPCRSHWRACFLDTHTTSRLRPPDSDLAPDLQTLSRRHHYRDVHPYIPNSRLVRANANRSIFWRCSSVALKHVPHWAYHQLSIQTTWNHRPSPRS